MLRTSCRGGDHVGRKRHGALQGAGADGRAGDVEWGRRRGQRLRRVVNWLVLIGLGAVGA